jgi:hypothetical protein
VKSCNHVEEEDCKRRYDLDDHKESESVNDYICDENGDGVSDYEICIGHDNLLCFYFYSIKKGM